MNRNEDSVCNRAELVRDYAFEELPDHERRAMQKHLTECSDCAAELDQLRLTTAALRVLPDVEVPRRIAFVSDQVFETRWFSGFWNSAARLGFASACVLAVGLAYASYRRPAELPTVVQNSPVSEAVVDAAVNKAVALAVDKAHAEDIQLTKAALNAVDEKYAQKQRNLMVAMQESMDVVRKQLQLNTSYAMLSSDVPRMGAGQ
jgi:anti-sigma factor RsiW